MKVFVWFINKTQRFILFFLPKKIKRKLSDKLRKRNLLKITDEKIKYQEGIYPKGINLIGYFKAEMGLGQGVRLLAKAIEKGNYSYAFINVFTLNNAKHTNNEYDNQLVKQAIYNTNIIHINAGQMDMAYFELPKNTYQKRYNIAFWLWELAEFPEKWIPYIEMVDEIWAPSEHICKGLRNVTNKPILCIPYGIELKLDEKINRSYFKLPQDVFLFLCMYDVNSTIERKNPLGAIEAFKKAFAKGDIRVGLVVKINNCNHRELSKLKRFTDGYQNIYFITDILPRDQINSLISVCDCFVSLHRAEGFGLVMAEAMYLKKAVIATNWSSNVEFMNHENACLVDYDLKLVGSDYFLSTNNSYWAEPKKEQAINYMKKIFENKAFYEKIVNRAYEDIRNQLSPIKTNEKIVKRLNELNLL